MKAVRIVFYVLLALVLVLLAAVAYLVATFDANHWKAEISQLVLKEKQRTLNIEGDLALSFFPSIGVRLGRATLSEHNSEAVFARVEDARISLRLLPLLSKQVIVDTVSVDGLQARLVRGKDGRLNIDDLLTKADEDEDAARFDIAGIHIANGQLEWLDEAAGQSYTVSALDFATGRLANVAHDRLELSAKLVGQAPKLDVLFSLKGEYRYDLDEKRYGGEKIDLRLNGDLLDLKGLDLALTARDLQLAEAGELLLDQFSLNANGRLDDEVFAARLSAPKLALRADQASGETIDAAFKLNGKGRNLDARLALSGIEGSRQQLKVAKLGLELDLRQGETALKGQLTSPVSASLAKQTLEMTALQGELDVAHPKMPMKSLKLPLTASLKADLAHQSAALQANTRFDESTIAAQLRVSRFSPLAANFDLDIDRLNVDRYLPPDAPGEKKSGASSAPAAESPIDLSALENLNLNGTVKIGQLQVAQIKASQVRLEIRAANGKLNVAPVSAQLYEGQLNGAVSVTAASHQLTLKQQLSNIDINPLMKDALDRDALEGRGNIALDVVTSGQTVSVMKRNLGGTASLLLRDGAIKGINLAKTFRESKALFTGRKDAVQQARQTEQTDFSELSASFRIANGVARNDDLSMKSPFIRLGGAGDIDLGAETLDYLAKASVVTTSGGQGGKELEHLKGLTIPVRLSGPFANPSWKIEFASLVADAAKEKVKEAVKAQVEEKLKGSAKESVKDSAKDKAGSSLKNLLKKK